MAKITNSEKIERSIVKQKALFEVQITKLNKVIIDAQNALAQAQQASLATADYLANKSSFIQIDDMLGTIKINFANLPLIADAEDFKIDFAVNDLTNFKASQKTFFDFGVTTLRFEYGATTFTPQTIELNGIVIDLNAQLNNNKFVVKGKYDETTTSYINFTPAQKLELAKLILRNGYQIDASSSSAGGIDAIARQRLDAIEPKVTSQGTSITTNTTNINLKQNAVDANITVANSNGNVVTAINSLNNIKADKTIVVHATTGDTTLGSMDGSDDNHRLTTQQGLLDFTNVKLNKDLSDLKLNNGDIRVIGANGDGTFKSWPYLSFAKQNNFIYISTGKVIDHHDEMINAFKNGKQVIYFSNYQSKNTIYPLFVESDLFYYISFGSYGSSSYDASNLTLDNDHYLCWSV